MNPKNNGDLSGRPGYFLIPTIALDLIGNSNDSESLVRSHARSLLSAPPLQVTTLPGFSCPALMWRICA
jgi:hypothetical protein